MSVRRRVRVPLRVAGFGALTATLLPLYAARDAMVDDARRAEVRDLWTRRWTRGLLRIFAVDVVIDGALPAPAPGGRLVVANHRSAIDIGLLLGTFGGRMVSRADLSGWPLVGAAARKAGTVFVDRASGSSGARVIRSIAQLLERGESITIFPEGTTFEDDVVRPFLRGGFVAAARAGATVLPVGIAYQTGSGAAFIGESFLQHLTRMAGGPPTRVVLSIGAPIEPSRDAAALAARAHAAVTELVARARDRVDR